MPLFWSRSEVFGSGRYYLLCIDHLIDHLGRYRVSVPGITGGARPRPSHSPIIHIVTNGHSRGSFPHRERYISMEQRRIRSVATLIGRWHLKAQRCSWPCGPVRRLPRNYVKVAFLTLHRCTGRMAVAGLSPGACFWQEHSGRQERRGPRNSLGHERSRYNIRTRRTRDRIGQARFNDLNRPGGIFVVWNRQV